MDAGDPPVVVGRITGVYGVRGWVKVTSFTDPPANLLAYQPWWVGTAEGWRPLEIAEVRPHGKGFVAKVEGCEDRDQARRWAGHDLAVPRSALPEPGEDEFYWHELIGMTVVTTAAVALGRVDRLLATGANDVLVVRDGDDEQLLPFIAEVVIAVDRVRGEILVDWDPGAS